MRPSVGRYVIGDLLGVGGMGVVCRAEDSTLRRAVALKFLAPGFASDEEYRARFFREARVAASLNHPNTCVVYEVGEIDSEVTLPNGHLITARTPFIAMELIEGETLAARLAQGTGLPIPVAIEIARQLAEGLAEAHARQIVHRDLKPHNVMMTPSGRVKIVDFGLAKPIAPIDRQKSHVSTSEMISEDLGSAAVIGTCAYMSPEQATGKPLDARSDIFAVGIVLYQMIAGKLPFLGETATETIAKILESDPAPLPESAASPAFEQIVWRCLQKRSEDRYPDARELLRELRGIALPQSKTADRRRWLAVPAAAILGLLAWGPFSPNAELGSEESVPTGSAAPPANSPVPSPEPNLIVAPQPDQDVQKPKEEKRDGDDRKVDRVGYDERQTTAGSLSITSAPRASVTLDGNVVGVTPLVLKADPGIHEIVLTGPDGLRWRGRVDVAATQTTSLNQNLGATGSLSVVSDIWADVVLDDRAPEQTPIHFPRVTTGVHSLRLSRAGYVTQLLEIVIEEDKALSVKVTLEREP